MTTTLNQHYAAALERFAPERMALACDETTMTFRDLAASVDQLTAGLRAQDLKPGDVVGYSLPNCPEAVAIIIAISRLGCAAVPLFPMIPAPVRAGIFASFRCKVAISAGPMIAALSEAAAAMHAPYRVIDLATLPVASGDAGPSPALSSTQPLLAAATSGTTGMPKSVWMTQGNVGAALTAGADMGRVGDWREHPDFCTVMAFPLSTSGILVTLGMLFAGARMVFSRDMSPVRYVQLAAQHQAAALSAPPSYFETLLSLPPHLVPPLPAVRAVLTGMDFLAPALLTRLAKRFPNLDRAVSGYGLVETSTVLMTWKAHTRQELENPTHVFALCPGVDNAIEVRNEQGESVVAGEQGELCVRGASVVAGYLGQPPGQSGGAFENGWFRTGDVVRRVESQSVELCGRQKYLIKRGGKSVSPIEVQDRLDACPGVLTSAVVGVKQPLYGEMIWAFVVAEPAKEIGLKEIMKECRANLPNYMVPDRVSFVAQLPRGSGAGKIDREALIRQAQAELDSMQGENNG